jgi:hypothetical protein
MTEPVAKILNNQLFGGDPFQSDKKLSPKFVDEG